MVRIMTEQNNQEQKETKKTLSKNVRNRIVGLLVIISVILIMVPFLLKDNSDFKNNRSADAIAITKDGAVTDNEGQLVSANEHDYSDLLDPEDDLPKSDNLPKPPVPDTSTLTTAVADNATPHMPKYDEVEEVLPSVSVPAVSENSERLTSNRTPNVSAGSEENVLRSNRAREKSVNPVVTTPKSNKPELKNSSRYAAQVGVFSKKVGADKVVAELKKAGFKPTTEKGNVNGVLSIRVYAAVSSSREEILNVCKKVSEKTTKTNCIVHPL